MGIWPVLGQRTVEARPWVKIERAPPGEHIPIQGDYAWIGLGSEEEEEEEEAQDRGLRTTSYVYIR